MTEPTRTQLKDMRIAAEYLSGGTLELIKEILVKHDKSILEEMRIHLKNEYKRGFYDGMEKAKEQSISEPVKERISEPVENLEPVAWMYPSDLKDFEYKETTASAYSIQVGDLKSGEESVPLYTAPPKREWQGLTDEEIPTIDFEYSCGNAVPDEKGFAREIEAKLREKNGHS